MQEGASQKSENLKKKNIQEEIHKVEEEIKETNSGRNP